MLTINLHSERDRLLEKAAEAGWKSLADDRWTDGVAILTGDQLSQAVKLSEEDEPEPVEPELTLIQCIFAPSSALPSTLI